MPRQSLLRVLSRYLPLLIWLAFIFYASSDGFSASSTSRLIGPLVLWLFPNTAQSQLDTIHFFTRKLAHFGEYALLGLLAARAFFTSPKPKVKQNWFLISLVLVIVNALLDEYHQSFVPTRTASIFDSFIDISGGLTALLFARWWTRASNRSAI